MDDRRADAAGDDSHDAFLRVYQRCVAARKVRKADTLKKLEACTQSRDVADALSDRRQLAACATWQALPHDSLCISSKVTATGASQNVFYSGNLASAWDERHKGLRTQRQVAARAPKLKLCLTAGVCVCRGPGRVCAYFWNKARQVLMSRCRFEDEKKMLVEGHTCLLLRGRSLEPADGNFTSQMLLHIAHHCGNPWRPTFTLLRVMPSDVERTLAIVPSPDLSEDDAYISFQLATSDTRECFPHTSSASRTAKLGHGMASVLLGAFAEASALS